MDNEKSVIVDGLEKVVRILSKVSAECADCCSVSAYVHNHEEATRDDVNVLVYRKSAWNELFDSGLIEEVAVERVEPFNDKPPMFPIRLVTFIDGVMFYTLMREDDPVPSD